MGGGGQPHPWLKAGHLSPRAYVTQVPILSLDRLLSDAIRGKRALILVDIEGAEYMMMQGAKQTLMSEPPPIWMMEISSTEHQPADIAINPNFSKTFSLFFEQGYKAFTADEKAQEITAQTVQLVMEEKLKLGTHNFVFSAVRLNTGSLHAFK